MSSFEESQHPRGNATNRGQFRTKENDAPMGSLDDRGARVQQAKELEAELNTIRRSGRLLSDTQKKRMEQLKQQIAGAYARPARRAAPLERLDLQPMNRTAMSFVPHEGQDDQLELNPPYQRGSVWTTEQRRALIESILRGIPIGSVTINDRWSTNGYNGDVGYAVVDGKQRVETIRGFFADKFSVPADWFEDEDIADETPDGEVHFSQLTERGRRGAAAWPIPTIQAAIGTVEGEAHLYGLLNGGGTAQTEADMANAREVAGGK